MSIFDNTNFNSNCNIMKTASLTSNLTYGDSKPLISVLFETDTTKEIRIVMKANQVMKEHKTSYPITVELFDGELNFGVNGEVTKLVKGDIAALDANVHHDLIATKDSIIRLTLSKQDSVERVVKVSEK